MAHQTERCRFVLLAVPRSGSTFVKRALYHHPDVAMYGEIFNSSVSARSDVNGVHWDGEENTMKFARTHIFDAPGPEIAAGFKLFRSQVRKQGVAQIWKALRKNPDIRVIRLERENAFASYVSEARARQTGHWQPTRKNSEAKAQQVELTLEPDHLDRYLTRQARFRQQIDETLAAPSIFDITFETLGKNDPATWSGIAEYLGISNDGWAETLFDPSADSATRSRSLIVNLDELMPVLARHNADWMGAPFA